MTPRSRTKLFALLTALLTLTALIVPLALPAAASHPANACLDVIPESAENPVSPSAAGSDNIHTLTAVLRNILPAGAPPEISCESDDDDSGATPNPNPNDTTLNATSPVRISFEVTGVNDPEATPGDSPETPDFFCTILTGQSSCTQSYTGTVVGEDEIRGWIDHDTLSSAQGGVNEADPAEGPDSNTAPGTGCPTTPPSQPEPDCTDVVTKTWEPNTVECTPETDQNPVNTSHTVTCRVHNSENEPVDDANVDAEASGSNDPDGANGGSPDFTCTTNEQGECSFQHGGTGGTGTTSSPGTTTYRAWYDEDNDNSTNEADQTEARCATGENNGGQACTPPTGGGAGTTSEPDDTDVVEKNWGGTPGEPFTLDCDDETGPDSERETNPSLSGDQSTETYTCTVRDPNGALEGGATIHGENESTINDPDSDPNEGPTYDSPDYGPCVTPSTGADTGICRIAVTQADGENGTAEICFWVGAANQGASLCSQEPTPEAQNADGSDSGNDLADQVEKTWEARGAAAAGGIDAEPETDTNTLGDQHTITVTVYDQFGTPFQGNTQVRFEFFAGSPSDTEPAASGNSPATPDRTCTTSNSTTCTTTYTQTSTAGKDLICVWINTTPTMTGNNTNGTCDGEGRSDADDAEGTADAPEPRSDDIDVVEKNWVVQRLECLPETDTNPTGTSHTITCTATDASGTGRSGVNVDAEATGANDPDGNTVRTSPDFTCTTDANGQCSFTHSSNTNNSGTTTYRAWIDTDNSDTTDNSDGTEEQNEARAPVLTTPGDTGGGGTTAEPDGTDVVTKAWTPSRLDCEPETANNQVRTSHTVTCTVRDSSGTAVSGWNVDVEATGENDPDNGYSPQSPDFTCTSRVEDPATPAAELGTCTFTHGPGTGGAATAASGTTTYRAWIDADNVDTTTEADQTEGRNEVTTPGEKPEIDDTDVVEKNWQSPGLECTPETDSNPTGTTHTITCTYRSSGNQPVSGARIDAEASGTNDPDNGNTPTSPDFTCQTDANGQCSFTHSGNTNNAGTTTYRAWVDSDNNDTTTEADSTEGTNEQTTPGGRAEPDETDVVEKRWVASRLDCSPETATNETNETHTITCTARDAANAVAGGTNIDVEATGANDPDNGNTPGTPDFTCTTAASGACDITHNPSATQAAGTTVYRAWIDADGADSTVEADTTETRDEASSTGVGARPEPDDTDVVEKTWVRPPARTIDCEPETATGQVGGTETVTCTVRDAQNRPLAGESVTFTEEGAGDFTTTTTATTDASGRATATVTSSEAGAQTVTGTLTSDTGTNEPTEVDECDKAANDPLGTPAGACSDSVTITWTEEAAECSDGVDNDGDGRTDFPADRGCASADDDSETAPRGAQACEEAGDDSNVIIGTDGDDVLVGTPGKDVICAAAGDDIIRGRGGADLIIGNAGSDTASGGGGKDNVSGNGGDDELNGNDGNDALKGQGGNDTVNGGSGIDTLSGGANNDSLKGGEGEDILKGSDGNDRLAGGADDDALDGGANRDRCNGGPGSDQVKNCE